MESQPHTKKKRSVSHCASLFRVHKGEAGDEEISLADPDWNRVPPCGESGARDDLGEMSREDLQSGAVGTAAELEHRGGQTKGGGKKNLRARGNRKIKKGWSKGRGKGKGPYAKTKKKKEGK